MINNLQKYIAKRVKTLRLQAGLTQTELEARAELGFNYINKLETKESNITINTLHKIIDALEVDVQTFFDMQISKDENIDDLIVLLSEIPTNKRNEVINAVKQIILTLR
ncbi:TPA: helix-turn-helix transcriptional regulator [Streptococcus suis]|uniref:helix-turn-helix domain-containing protein n=1 Tax=Streptococcus plurextorum TaxID=456876 RepID=UPI0003F9740E|nr:helix-turn-helix transcriptional regulator [Streptococcus plurextorum]